MSVSDFISGAFLAIAITPEMTTYRIPLHPDGRAFKLADFGVGLERPCTKADAACPSDILVRIGPAIDLVAFGRPR